MPNEKVLSEKQAMVEELADKLKNAGSAILVDYSGISVAEDTELRRELRENDVQYSVVKNTLLRFAAEKTGYGDLDPLFNGTTSVAISADPIAPARVISKYAKKFVNHFEVKGGFVDGKIVSVDEISAIAAIPPLPQLQAQVLGTMLAPITSLAIVLKAIAEKDGPVAEAAAE